MVGLRGESIPVGNMLRRRAAPSPGDFPSHFNALPAPAPKGRQLIAWGVSPWVGVTPVPTMSPPLFRPSGQSGLSPESRLASFGTIAIIRRRDLVDLIIRRFCRV